MRTTRSPKGKAVLFAGQGDSTMRRAGHMDWILDTRNLSEQGRDFQNNVTGMTQLFP